MSTVSYPVKCLWINEGTQDHVRCARAGDLRRGVLHAQQIGATDLLRGLADPSRWLTHSGDYTSKRHSPLTQITPENVARLTPLWTFETGLGFGRNAKFEATPIAIDGTLYVTGLLNHAWAIDGRTGALDLALRAEAAP